jgi:hypothetical protein
MVNCANEFYITLGEEQNQSTYYHRFDTKKS